METLKSFTDDEEINYGNAIENILKKINKNEKMKNSKQKRVN